MSKLLDVKLVATSYVRTLLLWALDLGIVLGVIGTSVIVSSGVLGTSTVSSTGDGVRNISRQVLLKV